MKKLLNDGTSIPVIGLGTWLSAPGEVYTIVKEAIKLGYRHIDCARCYENESEIGQALEEVLKEGVVTREELFITSKLWNDSHHPRNVRPALEKSLNDLKLDYLDLYLMHWPVAFKEGVYFPDSAVGYESLEDCPIIDTYIAMEGLVSAKLVKSLGVSNFSVKKLKELKATAKITPVMNQIELHPYLQQPAMLEYCEGQNIALTCYSPLGSSGRPEGMQAQNEPSLLENEVILKIAKENKISPAQVILAWSIERGTIVIPKTVNPGRAKENLSALDVKLEPSDMESIDKLDRAYRYVTGEFFMPEGSPYTVENLWD